MQKLSVGNWISRNTNKNTRRTYESILKQYRDFCVAHGVKECPAHPTTVASFMAQKLDASPRGESFCGSVKGALKYLHAINGYSVDLQHPSIQAVQRCAKSRTKKKVQKAPLLLDDVRNMLCLPETSPTDKRDKFLILLMFCGFLRRSEAVGLHIGDVWVDSVTPPVHSGDVQPVEALFIRIRRSKTDQAGEGATVVVSSQKDKVLCPVALFKSFTANRQSVSPYLFFNASNPTQPLSPSTPNHRVKEFVRRIGLDPSRYGSHSCRRGGTTSAAKRGIPAHKLKLHGRWKSDAVWDYIHADVAEMLRTTAGLDGGVVGGADLSADGDIDICA